MTGKGNSDVSAKASNGIFKELKKSGLFQSWIPFEHFFLIQSRTLLKGFGLHLAFHLVADKRFHVHDRSACLPRPLPYPNTMH